MSSGVSASKTRLKLVREVKTFEAYFVEEYPKMVALAAAVSGDRIHAEDIAQEAMSKLNYQWDKVSEFDKPGAWLRRVTINLAISSKRKFLSEAKAFMKIQNDQCQLVQPSSDDEYVWKHVKKLSKMQRSVVALHYLEGLSLKDVAEILDIKASTARVHLHRAKESLHSQLINNLEVENV